MPNYHYKQVGSLGHCLILAQILGTDPTTNEDIPSFFATLMIDKSGKLATTLEKSQDLQRISLNRNSFGDLLEYCQGYNTAASERRGGMMPSDWKHQQTIDPATVEQVRGDELCRLRAWPRRPGD